VRSDALGETGAARDRRAIRLRHGGRGEGMSIGVTAG
jgi:hypothetical protein